MLISAFIIVSCLFQLKHFVFDWFYQPPYQYLNKGTWGHWGGLVHSAQHIPATFLILRFFSPAPTSTILWLCLFEFLFHYHVDWAKMNINRLKGWGPLTSEWFWVLTGFDQLSHQLSYLLIILVAFS